MPLQARKFVEGYWRRREFDPLFVKFLRKVVEAAGVEPASERPVAAELYMRSRTSSFASGIKARRKRPTLVRLSLAPPVPDAGRSQSAKWRSSPARRLTGANVTA